MVKKMVMGMKLKMKPKMQMGMKVEQNHSMMPVPALKPRPSTAQGGWMVGNEGMGWLLVSYYDYWLFVFFLLFSFFLFLESI
jgi:hypothetical protein